ncbi:hypothetical protein HF966_05280 [Leuconostoc holzapfelii]|uniref:Uncharacterized protein n=2 Tax=Leuconostoc holzapfelii TaxID=434464 RepID=A0A846ZGY5_9LACO|nr:hypothetical protein [Leuconostoc holzapfelii]
MNMTVVSQQGNFVNEVLTLQYYTVSFDAGDFPNHMAGTLQVTPDDGVSLASTPDEVKAAAQAKITKMIEAEATPAAN